MATVRISGGVVHDLPADLRKGARVRRARHGRHGKTSRRLPATSGSAGRSPSRKRRQGGSMSKGCARSSKKGCGGRAAGRAVRIDDWLRIVDDPGHPFDCAYDCRQDSRSGDGPMQAIVYHRYGSPDVLELQEIPKPTPAEDQVLIRVHAASVNPYDWHFLRGTPSFIRLLTGMRRPKFPRLGADVAGVVEAVGAKVAAIQARRCRFRHGQRLLCGICLRGRVAACLEAARDFVRTSRMLAHRGNHRTARLARQRKSSGGADRSHQRCSGRRGNLCRADCQIAWRARHRGVQHQKCRACCGRSERTK